MYCTGTTLTVQVGFAVQCHCTGIALTELGVASEVGVEANKEYLPLPAGLWLFCPGLHFHVLHLTQNYIFHNSNLHYDLLFASRFFCHNIPYATL